MTPYYYIIIIKYTATNINIMATYFCPKYTSCKMHLKRKFLPAQCNISLIIIIIIIIISIFVLITSHASIIFSPCISSKASLPLQYFS
jgi:hypothetical protein